MSVLCTQFVALPMLLYVSSIYRAGILKFLVIQQISSNTPWSFWDPNFMWFVLMLLGIGVGVYAFSKLLSHRTKVQHIALERKVARRTRQIIEQKKELEEKSKELEKAYQEIKVKNMAIEEAFEHLSGSFTKLSDANREKDGMMNVVAHDLRTPLNNIEGLVMLVTLDGDLNEEQQDYVKKIKTVVKRGNEMIRDLLDISQARNRKKKLTLTDISISEFIQNWKISFEEPMLSKNQKLSVIGDIDSLRIHTDEGLLSRILDNLMSNALKFSEEGTTVHLDFTAIEDRLQITLRDEGPGISEADQQKMFKPFTQLSARPTAGEPSNGLGLSIVKTLVRHLKGKMELESALGKGTSFIINIPQSLEVIPVAVREIG